MAQVSGTAANPPNPVNPLQTGAAGQKQKVSPDKDRAAAEDVKNNPVETQNPEQGPNEASQKDDRVQISREAQGQNRESRADEGSRNENNLRPQREQIEVERGAAQKLRDLENSNARGVRDFEEASVQIEPEGPSGTENSQSQETREARAQSAESEETRTNIEQQAADNKNAEVQLREFQTKDDIRVEPKIVSEAVEEIEGQRAKAEAAEEPALEPPSQRIDPEGAEVSERTAQIKEQVSQEESTKNPPNPVSVQTETGQNVDDLI